MNAPLIVCNQEHRFIAAEQLAQIGIEPADIVLEPASRNTAPAILSAALWAERHAPECRLLILPSDHIIHDDEDFAEIIVAAADSSDGAGIVMLGVQAEWPNTDFGYILPDTDVSTESAFRPVAAFREKPSEDDLEGMLKNQSWLWNTGMILAAPNAILETAATVDPATVDLARRAFIDAARDLDFLRLDADAFGAIGNISFDKLVLEQADALMVAPLDMTWTDASNWQAVWQSGLQDGKGNVVRGDVILERTSGCLVISDETLTTALGVENLAIVVTDDSVLVSGMEHAKDLSLIVDRVAAGGGEKDLFHSRVYRPWGSYKGLAANDRFQVKEIVVNPGASLSLQKHFHRAEHWIVVEGTAKVRRGDEEFLLNENQSTYIPLGEVHRLENPGKIPIRLIEVQSGSYLGEDDIVRFEDTYGRN